MTPSDIVYHSNGGHGPLRARVIRVDDGIVYMERWQSEAGKRVRFVLTRTYFDSPRCGWKVRP